jgi:hypothetical protein
MIIGRGTPSNHRRTPLPKPIFVASISCGMKKRNAEKSSEQDAPGKDPTGAALSILVQRLVENVTRKRLSH